MAKLRDRLRDGWNAFRSQETPGSVEVHGYEYGLAEVQHPRQRGFLSNVSSKSLVRTVYNKLAVDVASVEIHHARIDDNDLFREVINSGLEECLTVSANIDQSGRYFRQDMAQTLFEEGVIAVVPVDTDYNPKYTSGFDIRTLRVGIIKEWYPSHVRISLYNERNGKREEVVLQKDFVAIVVNPFYDIMNEPNSTLNRLKDKMDLLDLLDKKSNSGKLDLIIQLPYTIKSESRKEQAQKRRSDIIKQLEDSTHGIAYVDATEKITQLNRPIENTLSDQVDKLKTDLYNQLGLTEDVFNGTANEETMLNYYARTIEPVVAAIAEEMARKFLSKTARSQKQSIVYMRDPFKLVPVSKLSDIADKFIRNEIGTSNEFRGVIGWRPSDDPKADQLRNPNMPPVEEVYLPEDGEYVEDTMGF